MNNYRIHKTGDCNIVLKPIGLEYDESWWIYPEWVKFGKCKPYYIYYVYFEKSGRTFVTDSNLSKFKLLGVFQTDKDGNIKEFHQG